MTYLFVGKGGSSPRFFAFPVKNNNFKANLIFLLFIYYSGKLFNYK